jgi:PBP1b-binding outer membrane lipoprotein LpoB
MRKTTPLTLLVAGWLVLAGCSTQKAQPAPAQKAEVTSGTEPTRRPVAETPDGSAANTGNRVNGQQAPVDKK